MSRGLRPLTWRDIDVLRDLKVASRNGWVHPIDLGGTNGSHHSFTLQKLVRHGYAEASRPKMNRRGRPGIGYKISDLGLGFLLDLAKEKQAKALAANIASKFELKEIIVND